MNIPTIHTLTNLSAVISDFSLSEQHVFFLIVKPLMHLSHTFGATQYPFSQPSHTGAHLWVKKSCQKCDLHKPYPIYTLRKYHCSNFDNLRCTDIDLAYCTLHSHKVAYKSDNSFHLSLGYSLDSNTILSKKCKFSFFVYHSNSISYFYSFGMWIIELTLTLVRQ